MFIPSSISSQTSILPQMEQGRISQLSELANPGRSKNNKQLKALSQQFESIFVHQLLKSMRSTVQKSACLVVTRHKCMSLYMMKKWLIY